jgi:hypothetical protein
MKVQLHFKCFKIDLVTLMLFLSVILVPKNISAQVTLETEVKITDIAMYFNGVKVAETYTGNSPTAYDYVFGRSLTPHGDCIKVYDKYVFMTWYRGGKLDRHVMLTRYNTETGTMKTIEFPHQHTGVNGKWWIGETHNTISVGICPKNGTIHMLYDMHRNGNVAEFANDYLRYSYTVAGAATVADADFTLENLFVQSPNNNYKHLSFPGITDDNTTKLLTYPDFFVNDEGDLFMKNRFGYSENGKFLFAKYDGTKWVGYTDFNRSNASSYDSAYNWGLYGDIKFLNGKIRVGFQQRANIKTDKYLYQNGFYYAYSDDPSGLTQWKDHAGVGFARPMSNSDLLKISEPGDLVATTEKDKVYMVGGFDWTVTDNGDVHFIGRVKDNSTTSSTAGQTKQVHTYKPAGASNFITTTDFAGAETLYANGQYVYIVGLTSAGRPYVERALGGTNDFTRIYQATTGKTFEKGIAYIHQGKLYYYLLEKNAAETDDARPTYLQIIDLNISITPPAFGVNLFSPTNNQIFNEGDVVALSASTTPGEGNTITKVEFIVNNQVINEDTSAPYTTNYTPPAVGTYTVVAKAYNSANETINSETRSFEVKVKDYTDLTGDTYRLKNVATGKFLQGQSGGGTATLMNDSGIGQDKEWTFYKVTSNNVEYDNIVSKQSNKILRAVGSASSSPPANTVVNTGESFNSVAPDKIWTVHYIASDDTYRFESGSSGKFMYHDMDGGTFQVYHSSIPDTDARSKWQAISTSTPLSISDHEMSSASIKVYPNPIQDRFTIAFDGLSSVKVKIYDMLGKVVYSTTTTQKSIELSKSEGFTSGIYIMQVSDENEAASNKKLVFK